MILAWASPFNLRPAAKHLLNARTCEYATVCSMLMIIEQ